MFAALPCQVLNATNAIAWDTLLGNAQWGGAVQDPEDVVDQERSATSVIFLDILPVIAKKRRTTVTDVMVLDILPRIVNIPLMNAHATPVTRVAIYPGSAQKIRVQTEMLSNEIIFQ